MVDTSQLIKNKQDLLSTKKVACMVENEQMMNLIISSPTKNILSRIFYEKTRLRPDMVEERAIFGIDRCLLSRQPEMIKVKHLEMYFTKI